MARNFNGSGDYLYYTSAILTGEPLTLACWFLPDNVTGAFTIVALGTSGIGGPRNEFGLLVVNGALWAIEQDASVFKYATPSVGVSIGNLYHGCGVFSSSTSRAAYLNGGNKGTNTDSVSPAISGGTLTRIGQRCNDGDNQKFDGLIAEVAAWNVALTDAEVAVLATGMSPLAVRPASLVAYWPLIGKYSPEIDVVGGFGMTLTGTPAAAAHPRVRYPFGHGAR